MTKLTTDDIRSLVENIMFQPTHQNTGAATWMGDHMSPGGSKLSAYRTATKPIKSPAGRLLRAGEIKAGQDVMVSLKTGRLRAPLVNRPKRKD